MDPRRKIDENYDRLQKGQIPFFESYTEVVQIEQPLGPPTDEKVLVIRINKSLLRLYGFLAAVTLVCLLLPFFCSRLASMPCKVCGDTETVRSHLMPARSSETFWATTNRR